jgi:integrase
MNSKKGSRGWNVYRRGDGGFVLQYRVQTGKWRETRVPREIRTEGKAEQWAAAWYAEFTGAMAGAPALPAIAEGAPTLRGLHDPWLKLKERDPEVEGGTLSNYRTSLNRHVLPLIGDVPLRELGPGLLRNLLRDIHAGKTLTKEGRASNQLVRNVAYTLTKLFDDALGDEWIDLPANPMRHPAVVAAIPPPQPVAEREGFLKRGEKVHLTVQQAEKLITCEAVPELRRVLYLVSMTSGGFRPGESYGLLWSDVHLDEKIPRVSVRQAYKLRARTKGGTKLGKTKTPDAVRDNPLHPLAVRALRAWKAEGWAKHVGRGPKPSDPVFPSPEGAHWRPRDAQSLREDLEGAKLPTKYRGTVDIDFQDATRHTFATWLAGAGVEEAIISRLMGHAAKSVARKHYIDDDLGPLLAAIKKIQIDLTMGKVVALSLAFVANGGAEGDTRLMSDTAKLTAVRGKAAASGAANYSLYKEIHADRAPVRISPVDARGIDGDAAQ